MFGVVASLALLATAASASTPVALEAPHAARQAGVPLASQHFTWGKLVRFLSIIFSLSNP